MYHTKTLKDLMSGNLPTLTFQRKMSYRTNTREVKALYRLINASIFNNRLVMPELVIKDRLKGIWGECVGRPTEFSNNKSRCTIYLSERWYCKQWLITSLAHEMVHQYQWDITSKKREKEGLPSIISHGPTFFQWREKLKKHGIPLKAYDRQDKWFATQHLFKC